jgi:elongator complex protein 3
MDGTFPCHGDQARGQIDAEVRTPVPLLGQGVGQASVATAKVHDRIARLDAAGVRSHTGEQPGAALGEGFGEALVEFPVKLPQELDDFGPHGWIIRWMTDLIAETAYKQPTVEQLDLARAILEEVRRGAPVTQAIRHHPLGGGGFVGKSVLVRVYRQLVELGDWDHDPVLARQIRMKPSRTLSGVTTVAVLTKPYPCPGECVFCPTDARMPKSYLPEEPGAKRALQYAFDPFIQTRRRMAALETIGHPTDKVELLVLGGTWSSYRKDYQRWFVQRCLDAMNGFESTNLAEAKRANRRADHRNVGLVVETRPDHVDPQEIAWLRQLGVTKIQMGAQSLDDEILALNKRGHTVEETRRAATLLRAAGFKIVLHWMPNLLGATLQSDRADFSKLWEDHCLRPDELKIYPNQLLEQAELYEIWQRGEFQPYTTEELIELLVDIKPTIPRYCRVNRIIRDFPSTYVVEGNRRTSLRQDAQHELKRRGLRCQCVRCREIRGKPVEPEQLELRDLRYGAGAADEHFLSFVTPQDRLAGFLRLSLPRSDSPDIGLPDLEQAALVREVHVYGQSLEIGDASDGVAQHQGLGAALVEQAEAIARNHGYGRMAVIAALGTRGYYARLGYSLGESYMVKSLE